MKARIIFAITIILSAIATMAGARENKGIVLDARASKEAIPVEQLAFYNHQGISSWQKIANLIFAEGELKNEMKDNVPFKWGNLSFLDTLNHGNAVSDAGRKLLSITGKVEGPKEDTEVLNYVQASKYSNTEGTRFEDSVTFGRIKDNDTLRTEAYAVVFSSSGKIVSKVEIRKRESVYTRWSAVKPEVSQLSDHYTVRLIDEVSCAFLKRKINSLEGKVEREEQREEQKKEEAKKAIDEIF